MDELERTKRQNKKIKFALTAMGLLIFLGILSGAPIWVYFVTVPLVGIIGYFGAPDSNKIDKFFKDF